MKIGIASRRFHRENDFTDYEALKRCGFDCYDHGWFMDTDNPIYGSLFTCDDKTFEAVVTEEARRAAAAGITVFQVHSPWTCPPPEETMGDAFEQRKRDITRSIVGTRLLGAHYLVIHPFMPKVDDALYMSFNRQCFEMFLEIAAENDVVLCLENMPFGDQPLARPGEMLDFVKSFHSPYFKMCLDTGHCTVLGEDPAEAVRLIGKDYLATLHIHDNDGKDDKHWIPGTGVINWDAFVAALKEIGYDGTFSFETSYPEPEKNAELVAWARDKMR